MALCAKDSEVDTAAVDRWLRFGLDSIETSDPSTEYAAGGGTAAGGAEPSGCH